MAWLLIRDGAWGEKRQLHGIRGQQRLNPGQVRKNGGRVCLQKIYRLIKKIPCGSLSGNGHCHWGSTLSNSQLTPGIVPGRLPATTIACNFADAEAPLGPHEARVAADRCYFCHDAPCITACPTSIDIPLFIRQIATGTPDAAARTIWDQNILGGMCARVCPT